MRLSDAFEQPTDRPELELVCHVYNINRGKNTELLSKCQTLREYMYFVDLVRDYHETAGDLEEAIGCAIQRCIEEDVLKEFLMKHRTEVMHVMTLDYTFERRLELQRAEAEEAGRLEGRLEGRKEGEQEKLYQLIEKKLRKNKSLAQIAEELEETPEMIRALYEQMQARDTNADR